MAIKQLQIAYDGVADRLVLRLHTGAGEEYLAHLTRRFVARIWPGLAAARPASKAAAAPAGDGKGRFDQAYESPADVIQPLGGTPLLVSEARIDRDRQGRLKLLLREHRQRSFSLTLDDALLEIFCAMLQAGAKAADWGLALADDAGGAAVAAAAPVTSSTLH